MDVYGSLEELEMLIKLGKKSIRDSISICLIVFGCLLMLIRSFYGLDLKDESFYLAVTERMFGGGVPFVEEWFPTQLIGILLLPLYSLYINMCGNQEGIILFVRLCYVIFSGLVALYLYENLKRDEGMNERAALCSSLLYLFYVRGNIPTLSYYSIGTGTFLLYLLLKEKKDLRFARIFAGISFAITVLCMPYMVIYFSIVVIRDVKTWINKEEKWYSLLSFYMGIVLCAMIFLIYCFSSGRFLDGLENIPIVLQDPEHQSTIFSSLAGFFVFMAKTFYRYLLWPVVAEFLAIWWWIWRKRNNLHVKQLLKVTAYLLFVIQSVYLRTFFEGGIIIAFLIMALQLSLINRQMEPRYMRKYLIPGVLFGFIWMMGSNIGQRAFNIGCVIADIWAFQIVWEDIRKSQGMTARIKKCAPVLVIVVMLSIRMFDVYRDSSVRQLTFRIEEGAGKGIWTTQKRKMEHEEMLEKLNQYAGIDETLVVSGVHPWIYLEAEARCGSFSVWNVNFADERNYLYYEKYPQNIPDVIFIMNPEYEQYSAWRFSSHGSYMGTEAEDSLKGWFKELVEGQAYKKYEESCGIFYVREKKS